MLNSFAHSKTKKKSAAAGENTTMGLFLVKKKSISFYCLGLVSAAAGGSTVNFDSYHSTICFDS